jgi:hypothetical protein
MAIKELSDSNPDGTRLGQASTDLIGFYGLSTPIVRPAVSAVATTTVDTTTNELRISRLEAALVNLGLIATDG